MMKGIDIPCMGKDSIGWGCMVAVISALMAKNSFTGVCPLFDDTQDPEWVTGLGNEWEFFNLYFKPYAACRWGHPPVAGALKIIHEHRLQPIDIQQIHVRTFEAAARLPNRHPRNTEEAQYNLAFPVAAALLDGEVGPAQVLPPRLYDIDLLSLMDRVTVEVDPQFEAEFPAKAFAEVVIDTTRGETFRSGAIEALWDPWNAPPTDDELASKFRWLTHPVIGKVNAESLIKQIWEAEQLTTIKPLIDLCCSKQC
jgi:2-methylcitrate dehydratase PrpD